MSIDYISVKIEPDNYVSEAESADDESYSKQALDLSKKTTTTSNNPNNSEHSTTLIMASDVQPEFVNIKMEPDINTPIKQEALSDLDDESLLHLKPIVSLVVPNSESVDYPNSEMGFKVAIKQEPIEMQDQDLLVERQLNQAYEENEVSEQLLSHNSTADGKYMCPICQKRFVSKGNVQRHQLLHNKEKLECSVCFKNFVKPGHLKKHILSHSVVKTYDCQDCGKKFRSSSNLDQHRRTHLEVKPFQCDLCRRQFTVRANLIKHQGKQCRRPKDQPIVCHVCDKTFEKEFLLRSHLRRHTTEKPYCCETCQMNFKYKSTLIRHIQLHNGDKPYSCKICKKTFTHAGLIKPHMRKHTGEKPYPCRICSKLFAHKHNMERHMLRHAKIKHLDCEICHKKFPKESRLVYHMRIHMNDKPFSCKICPKKFSHKQNALRHYTRKHPGEVYDCQDTDASIARNVWESVVIKKTLTMEQLLNIETTESNDEYVIP